MNAPMNPLNTVETATHPRLQEPSAIINALTVDVEDYFQVSALAPYIPRDTWNDQPCRVERNVDRLLELMATHGVHATFFTLGWIAERYPALIKRMASQGHEIASHGSLHLRATDQTEAEFYEDIHRAKGVLEDLCGQAVIGYRAPSFSIGPANDWAFDCIRRAGYRYSSSVYPVKHDHYGVPDAPRFAYRSRDGLWEIPITTTPMFGRNLPVGGGGYFRLMPYPLSRWAIRRVHRQDARAAIFYMHPWEIDPEQPRVARTDARTRFRHYVNLERTESRLRRLLTDFRWDRMDHVFALRPTA